MRVLSEGQDARFLCPLNDDIHALMVFKLALNEQYPISEAFAWYCDMRGLPTGAHLVEKPIVGLRDYSQRHSADFREFASSGIPFEIAPPKIVGRGTAAKATYRTRSFFVASLPNVAIRGRSAIIETADAVLLDAEPREVADVHDNLAVDPAIFYAGEATAQVVEGVHERVEFDEAFVSLVGTYSNAFGHWLWQYLPKYLTAIGYGALPLVPILVDDSMPRQHRQALELLVGGAAPIVEIGSTQMAVVGRAWYAPALAYVPLYEDVNELFPDYETTLPSRYRHVLESMRKATGRMRGTGARRIYLARRPNGRHDLVNSKRLEAILARRGFVTIYAEDLDFAEQARLVGHADHIVGPDGSAMYLVFFSRPGAKVCYMNQEKFSEIGNTSIMEWAGLDVTLLLGRVVGAPAIGYPVFAHYEIDERLFSDFLDSWVD